MSRDLEADATTSEDCAEACPEIARGRYAAGADPAKRDQILEGAHKIFMENGFDAASMGDICRAAGVSKGTIYVYFENKEDLFVSLLARERDRMFEGIDALLEGDAPLDQKMAAFGRRLVALICSDKVINAQRIIVGISQRMPELGLRFYETAILRGQGALRRLFEKETAAGNLAIDEIPRAAYQFVDLSTSGLWRPRLFGKTEVPDEAAIARNVDQAVQMFLATYGVWRD